MTDKRKHSFVIDRRFHVDDDPKLIAHDLCHMLGDIEDTWPTLAEFLCQVHEALEDSI